MIREQNLLRDMNLAPRYRFDLENGQKTFRDEIGVETDDLDKAVRHAIFLIEDLRTNSTTRQIYVGWDLVICDDVGTEIKRINI